MNLSTVIKRYEKLMRKSCRLDGGAWIYVKVNDIEAMKDSLKEKVPRLLKFDELSEAESVWFEERTGELYCALIVSRTFDTRVLCKVHKYTHFCIDWLNEYYEIDWRCWSAKPTDKQRKSVQWKSSEEV